MTRHRPPTYSLREQLAIRHADRVILRVMSPRTPTADDPRPQVWREETFVVGSRDAVNKKLEEIRATIATMGNAAARVLIYLSGPHPESGELLLAQVPRRAL